MRRRRGAGGAGSHREAGLLDGGGAGADHREVERHRPAAARGYRLAQHLRPRGVGLGCISTETAD
jgi:hypothetical protein